MTPTKAEKENQTKNIYQRINAVMEEVDYIQKDKNIKMTTKSGATVSYNVVTHDAVTSKVRPFLVKHGVVYHPVALSRFQTGNRTEVELTVRFASIDDPQDFIDVPSVGYGIDDGDKGPGKAVSYAIKYALLKTLGLETGDDADNDPEAKHAKEPIAEVGASNTQTVRRAAPADRPEQKQAASGELLQILEIQEKEGTHGPFLRVKTDKGWMSVFDSKLFDLVREGETVDATTTTKGDFINITAIND